MLPFAVPYPEPTLGFWGDPTSTIDWCEENYVASPYFAEIINTTTNSAFICLAIFSMVHAMTQGLEKRFWLVGFGFTFVGVGSWLFHMTLKYEFQLLDELPMIYATCVPFWSLFSFKKSKLQSTLVAVQISSCAILLTVIYLYLRDPKIHQTAYGLMNVVLVYECVGMTKEYVRDPVERKKMWRLMSLAAASFIGGYILWQLDNTFCNLWISMRRAVGMPYGFLLEGHGWWHLLTGLGVYYYIIVLQILRQYSLGKEKQFVVRWYAGLPRLDRVAQKID